MLKSELLDAVREDFFVAHPDTPAEPVTNFCNYVVSWLAKTGVVGVGHTPDGIALRLADGRELGLLFLDAAPSTADTPAVSIASSGVSARQGVSGESPSIRITGR